MKTTIERAIEKSMKFDFNVDSEQFMSMNFKDQKLLVDSLSEEEKILNLGNFKTLPNGKVGWNQKNEKY